MIARPMRLLSRRSAVACTALLLAACSGDKPLGPDLTPQYNDGTLPPWQLYVCKNAAIGTTATFSVSATSGTVKANPLAVTVTGSPSCALAWEGAAGTPVTVTVTELPAAGMTFLGATVGPREGPGYTISGTTVTVNEQYFQAVGGANVTYRNEGAPLPELNVTKTAGNPVVSVGESMSFTMTVTNTGPGMATGVTLSDPLPGGVGINWSISSQPAGNPCSISGAAPAQTLNCNFGDVLSGASRSVTVVGTTTANTQCAEYRNTVTVGSTNHETVTASSDVTVTGCTRDGFEGCTPGYWKQKQHFGSWVGYTPDGSSASRYNTVFGVNLFSSTTTLLQALSTGGGGAARFGRHSTAALLSASNSEVDYGMTAAGVIAAVQAAVASGNLDSAADEFERRNERECPLGR